MDADLETPVLIAGGGPAGLVLALTLACHGVKSIIARRNDDTTKWPKMGITNCRSMEIFNRLGVGKGLREVGVKQDYSFDVLFSSGLSNGGQCIAKWDLASPNVCRERIRAQNDGSMPREPYQRCSQAIFEAWLKPRLPANELIDACWSMKFEKFEENQSGVTSWLTDTQTGQVARIKSQYLVGCDGAGSRVRKQLGIQLEGGPLPAQMGLVHFKSRDLARLHQQCQFWHIFFSNGGVIMSQDEVHTWTVHERIGLDEDWSQRDPIKAIYDVLGGSSGSCPIVVDKIIQSSTWRPSICVAKNYSSGDAAHQNIPTGGYGMNTAAGDNFDFGWKLAACVHGYAGAKLLTTYELERKPVAWRNVQRSGSHFSVHSKYIEWVREAGPGKILSAGDDGQALRDRLKQLVEQNDGENNSHGIAMGYHFPDSPVVVRDSKSVKASDEFRHYDPTTTPSSRVPHMFLKNGTTSIYDLLDEAFTLVDFSPDGEHATAFAQAAREMHVPLTTVHLSGEPHVRQIWERDAVLVRPDDFSAWQSDRACQPSLDTARAVLSKVLGLQ